MWWKTGVIYQVYPRSFMDANGDGIGDLAGIRQRLDYLAWLGVDAVWFSPIFPSPMADFGYDVADYTDIHPDYGTLEAFDKLLVAAHSKGLRVILDLVPNHTSAAHAWFQSARRSRDDPKRDWYIWQDPLSDGSPPNNWLSYFGGPAWTFDQATSQYYMHNFDSQQPELNWRNPEVQTAIFDAIRFWLRRGVDGFRMDVIDRLLKDPEFRDNPPNPNWKTDEPVMWSQLRIHSEGAPGTHELMRQFRAVFDEFPETVAIGELSYVLTPEEFASFYGRQRTPESGDELHLPFNFGLLMLDWDAATIRAYVESYDAAVPVYGWPNYVLGNHDIGRVASRYGLGQARIAAMLLLTLRGTPTLYYGDEIGMTNIHVPLDRIQDPQARGQSNFNRDQCRAPMQWDDSPNAGFSPPETQTWLPVGADYTTINVQAQQNNPQSMLNFYRRLLIYRKQTPALHSGRYYPVLDVPDGCYAYRRVFNDQNRLIVLNLTHDDLELHLEGTGQIAISTNASREGETIHLNNILLRSDEGHIIEL